MGRKKIIIIFLTFVFFVFSEERVVDLTNFDFKNQNSYKLLKGWEFYENKLLNSEDINKNVSKNKNYKDIPIRFDKTTFGNGKYEFGYGTFRIVVKLPKNIKNFILRDEYLASSNSVYINGVLYGGDGKVGVNENESYPGSEINHYLFNNTNDGKFEIIYHISNYFYKNGGLIRPVSIYSYEGYKDKIIIKSNMEVFLIGCFFIMGIYHLGLFFLRRDKFSALYFGLYCLLIAVRTTSLSEMSLYNVFNLSDWYIRTKVEFLTYFLGIGLFGTFISSVFKDDYNKLILRIFQASSVFFSIMTLLIPTRMLLYILHYYHFIALSCILYFTFVIFKAVFKKREGSYVSIVGYLVLTILAVNDILYEQKIVSTGYIVHYGLIAYIFSQSFMLSQIFSNAFKRVGVLSKDLEKKNLELLKMDKLKDEFLANTSHELRTPLNGIIGIAESLNAGVVGELNNKVKKNLKLIITSGRRLSNLVNDILDFEKLKNKEIKIKNDDVNICTAIESRNR